MSPLSIYAYGFIIGLVIIILLKIWGAKVDSDASAAAKESPGKRAKVLKVTSDPQDRSKSVLIFELEDGTRVTLNVPSNTFIEGETGILRFQGRTFGSFELDK